MYEAFVLLLVGVSFPGSSLRAFGPANGVVQCRGPYEAKGSTYEVRVGGRFGFLKLRVVEYGQRSKGWRLRLQYKGAQDRHFIKEVGGGFPLRSVVLMSLG